MLYSHTASRLGPGIDEPRGVRSIARRRRQHRPVGAAWRQPYGRGRPPATMWIALHQRRRGAVTVRRVQRSSASPSRLRWSPCRRWSGGGAGPGRPVRHQRLGWPTVALVGLIGILLLEPVATAARFAANRSLRRARRTGRQTGARRAHLGEGRQEARGADWTGGWQLQLRRSWSIANGFARRTRRRSTTLSRARLPAAEIERQRRMRGQGRNRTRGRRDSGLRAAGPSAGFSRSALTPMISSRTSDDDDASRTPRWSAAIDFHELWSAPRTSSRASCRGREPRARAAAWRHALGLARDPGRGSRHGVDTVDHLARPARRSAAYSCVGG